VSAEDLENKRPAIGFLVCLSLFMFLFAAFRLTSAFLFIVLVLLYAFFPRHRSRRALIATYVLFILSMLLPIDVGLAGYRASHHGTRKSGLRLVRYVTGLGAARVGVERYGEVITGGCVRQHYDPKWILIWD
jgi:hypothetical protein